LFIKSKSISYTLKEKSRNDYKTWFKSLNFIEYYFYFFNIFKLWITYH
jgi:hypothetical protein